MKANLGKALLGMVAIAMLAACITGCVVTTRGHVEWPVIWVDAEHHSASHTYYYYPGEEVYFDPGLSFYYWRDGGDWRHGREYPRGMRLGGRQRFESDAERPYGVHDRVVQRFRAGQR